MDGPHSSPAYRPGREIARGGMGAVLDVRDQKFQRRVAMKVMLRGTGTTDEERQRFLQEARVLGHLAHPNIVPVHDLGVDDQGRLFYTMKLVQGVTLHDILQRLKDGDPTALARHSLTDLLTIFQKVCDAVAFAHSRGIIHRDLKPQNIMVGEFGEVLVMDWGLAKILSGSLAAQEAETAFDFPSTGAGPTGTVILAAAREAEATLVTPKDQVTLAARRLDDVTLASGRADEITLASQKSPCPAGPLEPLTAATGTYATLEGAVMGTPHYMSPEQAEGRIAELDARSDIFSLGGILYAILTLRPPVEGDSLEDILLKVSSASITPPTAFNPTSSMLRTSARAGGQVADVKMFFPLRHMPDKRVPAALSAVAMKALARDKARRYQTVGALSADIAAYQGGFATSAEEAGLCTQLTLLVRRHRREFIIGATAFFILVSLAVWFVINLHASEREATENAERAAHNAETAARNEAKAVAEAQRATKAEAAARREQEATRRALAQAQVALADAAFRSADYAAMVRALESCPQDLRDQSWAYLWDKRDASLGSLKVAGFESPAAIAAVPGRPGQFALANNRGEVGFVDVDMGQLLRLTQLGRVGLRELVFTGDGQQFAVHDGGQQVDFFDTETGVRHRTLNLPAEAGVAQQLSLNRDGTLLAVLTGPPGRPTTLFLLDARTGDVRWQRQSFVFGSALLTPGGDRIAVIGNAQMRYFWLLDAKDGSELVKIALYPYCQAMSLDGKAVAVGTQQGEALLVNTANGAVFQRGKLYSGYLNAMAWTSDGHLLTVGSEGKLGEGRWLFRLWNTEFLTSLATFAGLRQGRFNTTPWSLHPDGGHLLTQENPPRRWRVPVGREYAKMVHVSEQAWSGAFLSDTVLLARKGFELVRYDLSAPGKMVELPGPVLRATYCASHPASGRFAIAPKIGGPPFAMKLFATEGDAAVEKLNVPLSALANDLAFDAAADRIAVAYRAGGSTGGLEIFSARNGESRLKIPGSFERVAFAGRGGRLVALASSLVGADVVKFQLHQLDAATGSMLATVTNRFQVGAFAVSPDGKLVALGGSDRAVHLFDADTLREYPAFRAHEGEIGALAFHPTQPVIATASVDGAVKLWNHRTAKLLDSFLGLAGNPVTLSFSTNGRLLAVDGQERTSRVYDVSKVNAATP